MLKKLSTLPILTFFVLSDTLRAIAQQAQPLATPQPPQSYWPGPWHMYGWTHWWIGPLMMVLFAIFFIVMMSFMMGGGMMRWHRRNRSRPSQGTLCAGRDQSGWIRRKEAPAASLREERRRDGK